MNGSPKDIKVNKEISVNEAISHARHKAPRNLWVLLAIILRYLIGSFTENLKTPNDRILSHAV